MIATRTSSEQVRCETCGRTERFPRSHIPLGDWRTQMDPPHAFLFNANWEGFGVSYGEPCQSLLFHAVYESDKSASVLARVFHGDLLIAMQSLRLEEVEPSLDSKGAPSAKFEGDEQLFATLVWYFVESLKANPHSFDSERLPYDLARKSVYVMTLSSLESELALAVDRKLRSHPAYIGYVEVDLGDPIQYSLFLGLLFDDWFYKNARLHRAEYAEDPSRKDHMILDGSPIVEYIDSEKFEAVAPPRPAPATLSSRGQQSKMMLEARTRRTARERVVGALWMSEEHEVDTTHVALSVRIKNPLVTTVGEQEKLLRYVLNPNHPKGRHKARVFREVLGITTDDWRFLAAQLVLGIEKAAPEKVRATSHGCKYQYDIPVIGRNDNSRVVRTGWITSGNDPARLTTAYVLSDSHQRPEVGEVPPIIPAGLLGAERWRELYRIAHEEGLARASATIPTPFKLDGMPVQFEGACGFAWIHVKDTHSPFVEWLRAEGIGSDDESRGWCISATGVGNQSLDIKKAYVEAFAKVLQLNGIDCSVGSRPD